MKSAKFSVAFFLLALAGWLSPQVRAYEPPADLYRYLGTVRRVVDGNTLLADVDLGFGVWMHKVEIRLKDVKTPTLEEDREKGLAAFQFLKTSLDNQERILIQTFRDPSGAYTGWLAIVSVWDEDKEAWVSVNATFAGQSFLKP